MCIYIISDIGGPGQEFCCPPAGKKVARARAGGR